MTPRKVTYAKLQTEYFSTGTGNLGTVLGDQQKTPGIQMSYTEVGLHVKWRGVEFIVPPGNIVGVTLAPETTS